MTCFLRSAVSTNDTTARLGASAPSPLRNPPGTDERSLAVWLPRCFFPALPPLTVGSTMYLGGRSVISQCQHQRQQLRQQQRQQQHQHQHQLQSALDAHPYTYIVGFCSRALFLSPARALTALLFVGHTFHVPAPVLGEASQQASQSVPGPSQSTNPFPPSRLQSIPVRDKRREHTPTLDTHTHTEGEKQTGKRASLSVTVPIPRPSSNPGPGPSLLPANSQPAASTPGQSPRPGFSVPHVHCRHCHSPIPRFSRPVTARVQSLPLPPYLQL